MSTKRALLIGINYLKSTTARLSGCIEDIKNVQTMLIDAYGYPSENIIVLRDDIASKNPTRTTILNALLFIASVTGPNDEIWVHYSGHGSQIRDTDGDETDRQDETIVPVDYLTAGMISDDELFNIVKTIRGKAFLVFDSCHSGSICDLQYSINYVSGAFSRTITSNKSIVNPNIVVFSGCRDAQTSADSFDTVMNEAGGALTVSLLAMLRKNKHSVDIMKLYNDVCYGLIKQQYAQIPVLSSSALVPTIVFSRPIPDKITTLVLPPSSTISITQNMGTTSAPLIKPSNSIPVKKEVSFPFVNKNKRTNKIRQFSIAYHYTP
jgi:hypothetical protein